MSVYVSAVEAMTAGRRRYTIALIISVYVVNGMDRQILPVLIEPLRGEFSLTDGQLGLLAGLAFGVTYAAMSLPAGFLIDRLNRRNVLALSLGIWSVATGLAGFARSFGSLVIARGIVGASECSAAPACVSLSSDIYNPSQRATIFGLIFLGSSGGLAIAAVAGGWLAQDYGWRVAFFMAGLPGVILAALILLTVEEPRRGAFDVRLASNATDAAPSVRDVLRHLVHQPTVIFLLAALPLSAAAISAVSGWMIAFFVRIHHLDMKHAGAAIGLACGVGVGFGAALTGLAADKLSSASLSWGLILVACCLMLAVPVGWLALITSQTWIALALVFVWNILIAAYLAVGLAALANCVAPRMRGVTTSMRELLVNLIGYGMGTFIVGLLSTRIGGPNSLRWALAIVTGCTLPLSALFFVLASRGVADASVGRVLLSLPESTDGKRL
jgi:predicted MFS family arabinose efflux permease